MNVLVTGAQGCIGSWVVKQLLERGADVVMFDTESNTARIEMIAPKALVSRARIETGRIENTERIVSLVRDAGITHIVHLAAVLMPFCQANPVEGATINVIGTLNVFQAARDAGRPVRVVYASSSAVWGPEDAYGNVSLTEYDALKPSTNYGVYKQANEGSARVFYNTHGVSSIGLRPWTVFGVGRDRGLTADPTLAMKAVAQREKFHIRVSGHMDLQYVEDVAEIFIRCLVSPVEGAHVFNLAGTIVTMDELIGKLDEIRPGAAGLITAGGPPVPVAYRMDDSHLRATIGEMPMTPLNEAIQKTIENFEAISY